MGTLKLPSSASSSGVTIEGIEGGAAIEMEGMLGFAEWETSCSLTAIDGTAIEGTAADEIAEARSPATDST